MACSHPTCRHTQQHHRPTVQLKLWPQKSTLSQQSGKLFYCLCPPRQISAFSCVTRRTTPLSALRITRETVVHRTNRLERRSQPQVYSMLIPDQHPVLLARQMLQLATSLQQISPRTVLPGLSKPHQVIIQGRAESAITLVNNNDALVGTL
jgi:hypothetical protein